jgi:hypothetical protein
MKRSFLPEVVTEIIDTEENQPLETNEVLESFRAAISGSKYVHTTNYAVGRS